MEAKMRPLLIACALGLTACATGEAGADPIQADPELLTACVTRADGDRAQLDLCRGVVARPCIEAEGVGTMSEVLCWSEEYAAWRKTVDDVAVRIAANDEERGARLRRANEAWSAWLDAECAYRSYEYGGGSGEQVDNVRCAAELATERAINQLAAR
jgi:uncharacterized protein YecT (DUF1311 family)